MKWPVTRDKEGESGLVFLDLKDILKFTVQGGRRLVHTKDAVYYEPDNIDRLQTALHATGLTFERADRGSIINVDKVIEIDERNAMAYFDGSVPGARGKDSTISRPDNFKRILKLFRDRISGGD